MITEARTGPGTQVRVGALAALLLVLPAAAAPLCTPLVPPTWVVVSAWVAVMALVWAQARVLSHHVAVSAGSLWHDALLSSLACASALLALLLPVLRSAAGMSEALAVLVLLKAAAAVVSLGTGLSTLAQARRGADPRVAWSVAAGVVAVISLVLWPLRMAVPVLREPGPSAALAVVVLLGWAVVVVGLVRAPVPAEVPRRRAPWDKDLVSVLTCGTVATGVLLVGALVGIPTAAALAAALALGLLLSKVRLLVRELVSLQGSHEAAVTDELTGLGNRRSLVAALDAALQTREDVALLLLDLDRFKHVNDAMGHLAGDELLRQVAARLRGVMVSGAVLARLGGDEFAVLLSGPRGAGGARGGPRRARGPAAARRRGGATSSTHPPASGGPSARRPSPEVLVVTRRARATTSCAAPTPRCTRRRPGAAGWPCTATTTTAGPGSCCRPPRSSAWRSPTASWSCTTSRRWRSPTAPWWAWRPSCAGSTPTAAGRPRRLPRGGPGRRPRRVRHRRGAAPRRGPGRGLARRGHPGAGVRQPHRARRPARAGRPRLGAPPRARPAPGAAGRGDHRDQRRGRPRPRRCRAEGPGGPRRGGQRGRLRHRPLLADAAAAAAPCTR
ncbi:MAG: GGDEF domain-containing protein [Quadrisphaera sp.]